MSRIHTDLSPVHISVAPSPATSGLSLGVTDANAAILPDTYPWWAVLVPTGQSPTRSNAEIVKVTGGSSAAGTTTYVIVRAQGVPVTTAQSVTTSFDIYDSLSSEALASANVATVGGYAPNSSPTPATIPVLDSAMAMISPNLFRQALINGNQDVWQRGTSIALTTTNDYTSDRWYKYTSTAGDDVTVSRQDGTGVTGSYYCARVQRPNGQSTTNPINFIYSMETRDSIKFRGVKLTLSFWARKGANYSDANSYLVSKIVTGKGTDQNASGFTTSANAATQNNVLTTSWQKFTVTTGSVIASDITQLGVDFYFTPAGNAGAADYFEITQIQLCAGDVALPFQPKSYDTELNDCQRYCYVISASATGIAYTYYGVGRVLDSTHGTCYVPFKRPMRAGGASGTLVTSSVSNFFYIGTVTSAIAKDIFSTEGINLYCTVGSSALTTGQAGYVCDASGANSYMMFISEL